MLFRGLKIQPSKAELPILVTLLPMLMDVSPLQPKKEEFSIQVTLLGMDTEVRPVQPSKAPFPILVTLYVLPLYETDSGITTSPE